MKAAEKKYLPALVGLEPLRFLLSLCIVLFHYRHFYYPFTTHSKVSLSKLPLHGALGFVYDHGAYAVEIFWIISGFIFYKVYQELVRSKALGFKTFSLLRLTRLYPLHFATLLLVALLQWLYSRLHGVYFVYPSNDWQHFVLHLFFASNWGNFGRSFNGPVWSVSIEVFVYMLFFFAARWGLLRNGRVFAIAALGAIIYFTGLLAPFHECILFFFSGCMLCHTYTAWQRPLLLVMAYAAAAIAMALLAVYSEGASWPHTAARTMAGLFASCTLVLAFIYTCARVRYNGRYLHLLRAAGNLTYSMYMVHFPLQLALFFIINPASDTLFRSPLFLLAYVAAVVLAGGIAYYFFERPVQEFFRKRWLPSSGISAP